MQSCISKWKQCCGRKQQRGRKEVTVWQETVTFPVLQCPRLVALPSQQGSVSAAPKAHFRIGTCVAQRTKLCPLSSSQDSTSCNCQIFRQLMADTNCKNEIVMLQLSSVFLLNRSLTSALALTKQAVQWSYINTQPHANTFFSLDCNIISASSTANWKLFLDTSLWMTVFYVNGACKASVCFLLKLLTQFCPRKSWEHTSILVGTVLSWGKSWHPMHCCYTSGIQAVATDIAFSHYICHGCALQPWHWCLTFL